jgi:putative endonuclease
MTGGLGKFGESWAVGYLRRQGCSILGRNLRISGAEVDILARDGDELVFVEVKSRRSGTYGRPEEAVTRARYARLAAAAEAYMAEHRPGDAPFRIDVIAIQVDGGGSVRRCDHLRNVSPPDW